MTGRLARVAIALPMLLAGCAFWRPAAVPMPSISYPSACAATSAAPRPLIVLMPGRFMDPDEFAAHGIVDALRRRGIDADVVAVDAHLGYYQDRSLLKRLEADVIGPAHARGVRQVWLVGISLGAFGAMLYDESHADDPTIAGVVALGPYLGEPRAGEQVRAAGGLRAWRPPADLDVATTDPDLERARGELLVWRWLQRQVVASAATPAPPPLYLGYGEEDRFLVEDQLLAAALPRERVTTAPGGHDWGAWTPLWDHVIDALPLPRQANCAVTAPAGGAGTHRP